jgi:hypothetical protein
MGFDNPIRSPEGAPCRELEHKLQNVLMFSRATFLDRANGSESALRPVGPIRSTGILNLWTPRRRVLQSSRFFAGSLLLLEIDTGKQNC